MSKIDQSILDEIRALIKKMMTAFNEYRNCIRLGVAIITILVELDDLEDDDVYTKEGLQKLTIVRAFLRETYETIISLETEECTKK